MPDLDTYVSYLREEIRDEGTRRTEEYIANGTRATWILRDVPILSGSVSVYQNGVLVVPADYVLSLTTGELTFDTAPVSGDEIEALYQSVKYSDSQMIGYTKKAIERIESIYSLGFVCAYVGSDWTVNTAPSGFLFSIWTRTAALLIRRDNLNKAAEEAVDWRDGDKDFTESTSLSIRRSIIQSEWESIMWDLERLILESTTGVIRSGGASPLGYGDFFSDDFGPTTEDYLWWDGRVS